MFHFRLLSVLTALAATTLLLQPAAQADYYANPPGSGVDKLPHYGLQHHQAAEYPYHQTGYNHTGVYQQGSAPTAPPPRVTPQPHAHAHPGHGHSQGMHLQQHATPQHSTYTPAYPGARDFSEKVEAAKQQYIQQHPEMTVHNRGCSTVQCAPHDHNAQPSYAPRLKQGPAYQRPTVSEGARFDSVPQRELKFVGQNEATPRRAPGAVNTQKRPSTLFSPVKTMRPYDAEWNSTYFQ